MARPSPELLRRLAEWPNDGLPITSLYLDVDGRRHRRRAEYLARAHDLLRKARETAEREGPERHAAVCPDGARIERYLEGEFDRKGVRGLALFSCEGAGLWEDVPLAQPVRDRVVVGDRPDLLPLEAALEMAESICIAIVDRAKARLWLGRLGDVEEVSEILDDVPGRHDQGGWAQARLQRHIEDHVQRHLKHVADVLFRMHEEGRFDRLVLSGPDEVVAELERELHDYVRRVIAGRVSLAMAASPNEVLKQALEVERDLERAREIEAIERLRAEIASNGGRAVGGLEATLEALEAGRVGTLVVSPTLRADGLRCPSCGHLATEPPADGCPVCGTRMEDGADLVEEAVESALRRGARVEAVGQSAELDGLGGIGALLRF